MRCSSFINIKSFIEEFDKVIIVIRFMFKITLVILMIIKSCYNSNDDAYNFYSYANINKNNNYFKSSSKYFLQ